MTTHRFALHGRWSLWPWFAIRAPGFPAELADAPRELAADPRFREATLWQRVRGLDAVSADATDRELARAAQRLCVRNDTVDFFGPVGWGTFVDSDDEAAAAPGPALLASRTVYLGHWGVDELAAKLSESGKLLRDVAPRRMPMVRLDGTAVQLALGARKELPAEYARLLAACDGTRTARELAAAMASGPHAVEDETDVYDMLGDLRDRKLVVWSLQIETYTEWPERELRGLVARADAAVRDRALAPLVAIEAARDRVAAVAGDPDAIERALGEVDAAFVAAIGPEATQRARAPGSGRTLVYEECRRDYALRLGPGFRRAVGPALALVLDSARWYTHAIAERCRASFREIHAVLVAETGAAAVDYIRFLERAAAHAGHPGGISHGLVDEVAAEVSRRWAAILTLDPAAHRVQLASDALAGRVAEAFAAPEPGWGLARLPSVDLYAAARAADAVVRGDALFVLGDVIPSTSLAIFPFYLRAHPDPDAVIRACGEDTEVCRVAPIGPKPQGSPQDFGPVPPCDYDIEFGANRSLLPRERVLAVADLVVVATPDGVAVETRDGRLRLDIIACFEESLLSATMPRFQVVAAAPHVPRVTIDRLVIARERWQLAPGDTPFQTGADVAVWARERGIPRRVFVKTPEHKKAVYADLDSPVHVELVAELARGASQLTITEMLPAPDALWLADGGGKLYTSQLRLTACQFGAGSMPRIS